MSDGRFLVEVIKMSDGRFLVGMIAFLLLSLASLYYLLTSVMGSNIVSEFFNFCITAVMLIVVYIILFILLVMIDDRL